jgi:hypothetical protein
MTKKSLKEQLKQVQQRLREQKIGVALMPRGNRLYLRATLPPKPGSNKTDSHQQDIALGIYANSIGIERAEAEARQVGALMALGKFDWNPYLRRNTVVPAQMIGELRENFKKEYLARNGDTETTRSSWKSGIEPCLKDLPPDQPLTEKLVLRCINNTEAKTSKRKRICYVLKAFAKFAGIEMNIDFNKLGKGYSSKPRELPDDELIREWFYKISKPKWQAAYGYLAVYGLRPHELYHLDLTDFRSGADFVRVKKRLKRESD